MILGISDTLPSSPITFLRPDVLIHVHDLWKKKQHEQLTHRSFTAVFHLSELQPFAVMGLKHLIDFVRDWKFSKSDIAFLKLLPSFTSFDESFWNYLERLKFPGSINAVPEGEIFGTEPVQMSDEVRRAYNYVGKSPFPLLQIEGPAAVVALMSEFVYNILSQATLVSMTALRRRTSLEKGAQFYGAGELQVHPLFALLDNRADAILGNRPLIFEQAENSIAIRWRIDQKENTSEIEPIRAQLNEAHGLNAIMVFLT